MSRLLTAAYVSGAVAFWAIGAAVAQTRGSAGLVSPWTELHSARVRLIAGPAADKPAESYLAGVDITLAEGWKTYWRNPGDAGVPPNFEWSGSANVASIKVLYPAPSRLHEPAAETIGYMQAVMFPVEVMPQDARKPVELKLTLEFGVCREICIPAQAALSLAIPPRALAGDPAPAILASLARVPRPQDKRRADDPELKGITASLDGPTPRLEIGARFPRGGKGGDLFIEAPDGLYVPMPKRLPDAADGTARFEVDLARSGIARELKGKSLTFTLVSDAGATEAVRVVE
jgi:DsbC/DsbD-like thiol-disulfide interchange protein